METSLRFYETLIFVLNWILPPLMMAATAGLVIWKVRKEHYGEKNFAGTFSGGTEAP